MLKRLALRLAVALTVVSMFASCGSSRGSVDTARRQSGGNGRPAVTDNRRQQPVDMVVDPSLAAETKKLLSEAKKWLGVPYLYGGSDRNGVDCSGFVLNVFSKALEIKLPRTSRQQNDFCTKLSRAQLQPGDLVFFDTKKSPDGRVSHVGLYVGNGNMIHASSSKGVIVTSIDSRYYASRFLSGGRVESFYAMIKGNKSGDKRLLSQAAEKSKKSDTPKGKSGKRKSAKQMKQGSQHYPESKPAVTTPEPPRNVKNVSDARTLVLNSLIEEKLDSICTPQASR